MRRRVDARLCWSMPPIRVMWPPRAARFAFAAITRRPWLEFAPGFHGRTLLASVSIDGPDDPCQPHGRSVPRFRRERGEAGNRPPAPKDRGNGQSDDATDTSRRWLTAIGSTLAQDPHPLTDPPAESSVEPIDC